MGKRQFGKGVEGEKQKVEKKRKVIRLLGG